MKTETKSEAKTEAKSVAATETKTDAKAETKGSSSRFRAKTSPFKKLTDVDLVALNVFGFLTPLDLKTTKDVSISWDLLCDELLEDKLQKSDRTELFTFACDEKYSNKELRQHILRDSKLNAKLSDTQSEALHRMDQPAHFSKRHDFR